MTDQYLSTEAQRLLREVQAGKQEIAAMLISTSKTDYIKIEGCLKFVKALEKYADELIAKEQKEFENEAI